MSNILDPDQAQHFGPDQGPNYLQLPEDLLRILKIPKSFFLIFS